MKYKICKICNVEKILNDFPYSNKELNLYRTECKECYSNKRKQKREQNLDNAREYGRNNYKKNKENVINSVKEYRLNNKEKTKIWSKNYRLRENKKWEDFKNTLECEHCGENDGCCLEFHHINPENKLGVISKLRFFKYKLQEELNKCIVLCSNCHRKLHNKLKKE